MVWISACACVCVCLCVSVINWMIKLCTNNQKTSHTKMEKFLKWFKDSLQLDLYCDGLYTYKYRLIIINKLITKIGQLFTCSWLIYFSILFNFHFWCVFDLTIIYYSDGGFYFCFRFRFVTAFSCQNLHLVYNLNFGQGI